MFDKTKALDYILEIAYSKGISQARLCENIYDYSHFNRMCNGKENINTEVLLMCAEKLCISFDELNQASELSGKKEVIHYIEEFDCLSHYHDIDKIKKFSMELSSIDLDDALFKQLKLSVKAFLLWRYDREVSTALNVLLDALKVTVHKIDFQSLLYSALSDLELNIINDIALCLFDLNRYDESLLILQSLVDGLSETDKYDKWVKFNTNIAILCYRLQKYDRAMAHIDQGISKSLVKNIYLYLLSLYYQKAIISYRKNDLTAFEEFLEKSYYLALAQNCEQIFIEAYKEDVKELRIDIRYTSKYLSK